MDAMDEQENQQFTEIEKKGVEFVNCVREIKTNLTEVINYISATCIPLPYKLNLISQRQKISIIKEKVDCIDEEIGKTLQDFDEFLK